MSRDYSAIKVPNLIKRNSEDILIEILNNNDEIFMSKASKLSSIY